MVNKTLILEEEISQKEDEIKRLKELNSIITKERNELEDSLIMTRFSSYARLNDYNDSFDNLKNIYNISSKYQTRDDWYILNEEYFYLELSGYTNAKKVDFYLMRLESDQGRMLIFADNDPSDGWTYINDKISETINKHTKSLNGNISYEPYFILYTEVTLECQKR